MITEQTFFDTTQNIKIIQNIDTETNLLIGESKHYKNDQLVTIINYRNGLIDGESRRYNSSSIEVVTYDNGAKKKALIYQTTDDTELNLTTLVTEMYFENNRVTKLLKYSDQNIISETIILNDSNFIIKYFSDQLLVKRVKAIDGKKYVSKFDGNGELFEQSIADNKNLLLKYSSINGHYYSNELNYSEYSVVDEKGKLINIKTDNYDFTLLSEDIKNPKNLHSVFIDKKIFFEKESIKVNFVVDHLKQISAAKFKIKKCDVMVIYKSGYPICISIVNGNNKYEYHLDKNNFIKDIILSIFGGVPIFKVKEMVKKINTINVKRMVEEGIELISDRKSYIKDLLLTNTNFNE